MAPSLRHNVKLTLIAVFSSSVWWAGWTSAPRSIQPPKSSFSIAWSLGPLKKKQKQKQNSSLYFYLIPRRAAVQFSYIYISSVQFSSSLSHVWLFATPWTAARQASLSITNSQSLLKLMPTELVMPSNHLILCRPLLLPPSIFPSIRIFSNKSALHIRWPSIGASASTSVLPVSIQDWFPFQWTGWISFQSKGLSRVFSNTTNQFISSLVLSFLVINIHSTQGRNNICFFVHLFNEKFTK